MGCYSDGTAADITDDVEWQVGRVAQGPAVTGARFASNTPGYLILENTDPTDIPVYAGMIEPRKSYIVDRALIRVVR